MKFKEIKSLSKEDLKEKLIEMQKELMKLNTQRATGTQLKKTTMIRAIRRNIAMILMLLNNSKSQPEQKAKEQKKTVNTEIKNK